MKNSSFNSISESPNVSPVRISIPVKSKVASWNPNDINKIKAVTICSE